MDTENADTEHKKLSKVCKKSTSVCVSRLFSEKKFTNELNVFSWKFMTENKNQRISIESEENWCESKLEELMSVKPLHSDDAYIFSNRILFYKSTAFFLNLQTKESKL